MADKCPFTFVTTHFREVFDFDLLRTRHLVSLLHMDFLKEKTEVRMGGNSGTKCPFATLEIICGMLF